MKRIGLGVCLVAVLVAAGTGIVGSVQSQDFLCVDFTAEVARGVLDELGLDYTEDVDSDGYPLWEFAIADHLVTLLVFDDNPTKGGYESLMLYGGFILDAPRPLQAVNLWNERNRFARAFLDVEGDLVLECDLLLLGGVTKLTVKRYISLFGELLDDAASILGS